MSDLTYTVAIKGPAPSDLAERIIQAHAAAVASRLQKGQPFAAAAK